MRLEKDNAIRLFNCEAPGSEGIKLEEIFYEEKMEDGGIKKVVQHVLNPEMVPYIPSSSKDKKIPAVLIIPAVHLEGLYTILKVKKLQNGSTVLE